MQYSYIEYFDGWEKIFLSGNLIEFQKKRYIELDSMVIDNDKEAKYIRGRKALYQAKCPICQDILSFNKGSKRVNKNPYFFHLDKEQCFLFESLAHARTKKYLYELFSKAGYIVKEEKRHKDISRADVAVLQTVDGKEELKLAIEVQASNIRISNIEKRTNIYFEENVPTAWVLILDNFFPPKETEINGEKVYTDSYSGTRISYFNPETNSYEYTYISPLKEEYFFVTGANNNAFNYLMDVYNVIVTVDHNGHVFLIRRTPESSKLRADALLENREHSTQDDIFLVNRIAESDIVPVLLETELLRASHSENDIRLKKNTQLNEDFKGRIHRSDSDPTNLVDAAIEFDKARQIEEALNSIELARKAREDMKIAYTNKLLEIEQQKAEEHRRQEETLAEQMAKDYMSDLYNQYKKEFSMLVERLETEKVQFHLSSIGKWYSWLNYLKEECHKWYIVVKTLFKGFPTSFLSDKNDYEMYFNEEQNSYKKWIEGRNLNEFVEELQQHYEQETNNTKEKIFYQELLTKYGQKLDKVQKKEKIQREQEKLRIRQEKIKKEEEERKRIQLQKEQLYRKQELLNKDYDEIPLLTKKEIDNLRDRFWEEYKSIPKKERTAYERKYFPSGLPRWFMKDKIPYVEKEIEAELKKQNSKNKEQKENLKDNDDGYIQLKLL
ncbi:competence protein CoiA family protein [Bacillus wiedmannii]|uniref:competence protein CoiA family protein n=1 Tax=Bacillus wiedmannii TaxID=1890302 RepID=UPI002EC60852|nr:competence protein CoiA family protein [Bacillus wiedmannii]